jgi:hypothetical protein
MEDNKNSIESLLERAIDYGKTSFELVKLKAIDKASNIVSTLMPHLFAIVIIATFMLFINLGIAFWLGEILGKIYYGFFLVAGFYVFVWIFIHFLIRKWIKKCISDYFIKKIFK